MHKNAYFQTSFGHQSRLKIFFRMQIRTKKTQGHSLIHGSFFRARSAYFQLCINSNDVTKQTTITVLTTDEISAIVIDDA